MKTRLLIIACMASGMAAADEWRTEDTVREVIWHAVNVVDYGTTMDMARRNEDADHQPFKENNPFIGSNPSPRRVANAFVIGAIAHAATSYLLPQDWRERWQYLSLAMSIHCARNNLSIGLRVNF